MKNDLERAKEQLQRGEYTCVLCCGDRVYTSQQRGVRPLLGWLESDHNFEGYAAADKVVGKATAFLYVLLGVSAVYARVISRAALDVFVRHRITVIYDQAVDGIINRAGNGPCPFEAAVLEADDAATAYAAICQTMQLLSEYTYRKRGDNHDQF